MTYRQYWPARSHRHRSLRWCVSGLCALLSVGLRYVAGEFQIAVRAYVLEMNLPLAGYPTGAEK